MHRTARVPVDVIGLQSITGTQQVWLLEAHGSFARLETTDKALGAVPMSRETLDQVNVDRPEIGYQIM